MSRARVPYFCICILALAWGIIRALNDGTDLDDAWQAGRNFPTPWDERLPAIQHYPPSFDGLMSLLSWLPWAAFACFWLIISAGTLLKLPSLFAKWDAPTKRGHGLAWIFITPFAVDNLILGQWNPILLFLAILGLFACRRNQPYLGGALLGLGIALKLLPAPLLAIPLILQRDARPLLGAFIPFLVLIIIQGSLQGWQDTFQAWLDWSESSRLQFGIEGLQENPLGALRLNNQGLIAILSRHPWVSQASIPGILITCWAALLLPLFALLKRGLPENSAKNWSASLGLVGILTLWINPLAWTYAFFWMLPAAIHLSPNKNLLRICLLIAWAGLLSNEARSLGVHFLVASTLYFGILIDLWSGNSVKKANVLS
jgi:hypothetical protein